MKYKRGDVYYINAADKQQSVGHEIRSGRPAIIVSNNKNNAFSQTLEVVYLTTQSKPKLPTHCQIYATHRISTALCEQVTTVSVERVGDYLGSCNGFEMQKVDRCIRVSLSLDNDEDIPVEEAPVAEDKGSSEELIKITAERDIYKGMYENLLSSLGVKV